jgi:amino-acid N-acetyltransferase
MDQQDPTPEPLNPGSLAVPFRVRRAQIRDVPAIKAILDQYVNEGMVLPKSLGQLYETIRDFYVGFDGDLLAGAGALHILWDDLAEVRSLAVLPEYRGAGLGRTIVEELLAEAERLGVGRVFALTYAAKFFQSFGFRVIDKTLLPKKIWADCIHCHKFPMCDEIAVIKDFRPYPEGPVGPPPELPQVINLERLMAGLRKEEPKG